MGYIKEPPGINFVVDSRPLTAEEKKKISEIISYYNATGKKMAMKQTIAKGRLTKKSIKKNALT